MVLHGTRQAEIENSFILKQHGVVPSKDGGALPEAGENRIVLPDGQTAVKAHQMLVPATVSILA